MWKRLIRFGRALTRAEATEAEGQASLAVAEPQLLEAIVEEFPAMVFMKDADELRFVLFNRAGEELLGIPRGELLGKSDYDLFPVGQADFFTAKDREVLARSVPLDIPEEEILSSSEGLRILHTRKIPISDESGAARYLLGISQDITELKHEEIRRQRAEEALARREAHFRSLIEYASDLVLVIDATGAITYAGPSIERVLGFAPEEVLGQACFTFVHPDDRPELLAALHAAIENPTPLAGIVFRGRNKAGTWRTLEATVTNALSDPAVTGVVVNTRDVTERVELEKQYLQAQKMEAVGNLAGGVAHDFNNLLTVISTSAALLLEEMAHDDPHHSDVAAIVAAAMSAGELTRQLLTFSRRQVLQPALLDVAAVVKKLEPLVRRIAGEDITVAVRQASGQDVPQVFADRAQIEQVILNLCMNARQAMPEGGTLTIGVSVTTDRVLIDVTDTGIGMSEEVRARVFEPFFTTKPLGTGLGLATVDGFVKQSRGTVSVESRPGQGATFRIALPRAPGSIITTDSALDAGWFRARPGETILLVEDEALVRATVHGLLARLGYTVLEAANGPDALIVAARSRNRIDLVLTDMVMPRMSGTELAERIRLMRPGLPVVFMTGYTDTVNGIDLTSAMRVLSKPLSPEAVGPAVRTALDGAGSSAGPHPPAQPENIKP